MLNRRDLLKVGAALGPALAVSSTVAASSNSPFIPDNLPGPTVTDNRSPKFPPFRNALRLPSIATPVSSGPVGDTFQIVQKTGYVQLLPGPKTQVWGYNGMYPGPTFLRPSGRRTTVVHRNALPTSVVVHFHGGHSPPSEDGYPSDFIAPGASREYNYPVKQRPSTLWYHDHSMDFTSRNVYMGLAGFFLVTGGFESALPLPKGEFDVPLLLQDRIFTKDNQFFFPGLEHDGVMGDTLLVNGTVQPFFRVARRKYRFRLLNGSTSRTFLLALSNGMDFIQIGTDLGLMPAPVVRSNVLISIAERYEVIIDFSRMKLNSSVILKNLYGNETTTDVMRFDVVRDAADDSRIPDVLSTDLDLGHESQAAARRTFKFERSHGQWVINDKPFEPHRVDAWPKLGTREVWTLINGGGGWVHPIHMHDVGFAVLDRNGIRRPEWENGLKDTVFLGPGETVRFLTQPYKDYTGQYAFHCHNTAHEDIRMMGTFEVVA